MFFKLAASILKLKTCADVQLYIVYCITIIIIYYILITFECRNRHHIIIVFV